MEVCLMKLLIFLSKELSMKFRSRLNFWVSIHVFAFDQQYWNTGLKTQNVEKFDFHWTIFARISKVLGNKKSLLRIHLKNYWIHSIPDGNWQELLVCSVEVW